jgi:hypothetical protein
MMSSFFAVLLVLGLLAIIGIGASLRRVRDQDIPTL